MLLPAPFYKTELTPKEATSLIELIGSILTEEPSFRLGFVELQSEPALMLDDNENPSLNGTRIKIGILAFQKDENALSEGEDLWQSYLDRENKAETRSAS